MNKFFITLLLVSPCLAATIGAATMAMHGIQGWGWLVMLAILLSPQISFEKFN